MIIEDFINRKDLSNRLEGDMELYQELADLFIEDSDNLLKSIENAIKESDTEKLRKAAHTIKGSVSNFSAQKAFDAALKLENIGKNKELDKAGKVFKDLEKIIEETKKAMKLLAKEDRL